MGARGQRTNIIFITKWNLGGNFITLKKITFDHMSYHSFKFKSMYANP